MGHTSVSAGERSAGAGGPPPAQMPGPRSKPAPSPAQTTALARMRRELVTSQAQGAALTQRVQALESTLKTTESELRVYQTLCGVGVSTPEAVRDEASKLLAEIRKPTEALEARVTELTAKNLELLQEILELRSRMPVSSGGLPFAGIVFGNPKGRSAGAGGPPSAQMPEALSKAAGSPVQATALARMGLELEASKAQVAALTQKVQALESTLKTTKIQLRMYKRLNGVGAKTAKAVRDEACKLLKEIRKPTEPLEARVAELAEKNFKLAQEILQLRSRLPLPATSLMFASVVFGRPKTS